MKVLALTTWRLKSLNRQSKHEISTVAFLQQQKPKQESGDIGQLNELFRENAFTLWCFLRGCQNMSTLKTIGKC